MYTVFYSTAVKKDIKSLPQQVQDRIFKTFEILEKNPKITKKLKGEFSECYSYGIIVNKIDYRIIYTLEDKDLVIVVVMIGSRENIYKQLKRRL